VIKKFLPFLLIFIACSGAENSSTISEEEIQRRIDEAVETAIIEAEEEFNKKLFLATSTTTTIAPTTTTTNAPTTTLAQTTTTTLAPTTTTTTTTTTLAPTTTTTTIPYQQLVDECYYVEEVNLRVPQLVEFTYLNNFNVSKSDTISFSYKIVPGTYELQSIWLLYEDNFGTRKYAKSVYRSSFENGIPLEGVIATNIPDSTLQPNFSYTIESVQLMDINNNEIFYMKNGSITNRVDKSWCELNHNFFSSEFLFKIDN